MKVKRLAPLFCAGVLLSLLFSCAHAPDKPLPPDTAESGALRTVERETENESLEPIPDTASVTEPAQTEPVTAPSSETKRSETDPPVTKAPETKAPETKVPETKREPKPIFPDPPETEPAGEYDPDNVTITLSFTGDCTLGRNHLMKYENSFDDYYDRYGKKYFLSNVRDIFAEDDLTVINLEGPLTVSDEVSNNEYMHRGRPAYTGILTSSFVDVCTLANNHRFDYMESGAIETMETLTEAKLSWCFDSYVSIRTVKGVKVAIVSANLTGRKDLAEQTLKDGIRTARKKGAAIVVACVHWGTLKTPVLSANQTKYAKMIVGLGYDLVIGCHPHVLQAVEKIDGVYVAYSLGNFCYGGNNNPLDKDSCIFQKTFTIKEGVLQKDDNVRFLPCSLSSTDKRNDFRPTLVTGSEKTRILEKMNGYCEPYSLRFEEDGRVTVSGHEETDPIETEPIETDPIETDPIETEPIETEPIETEPTESEPIETAPAETESKPASETASETEANDETES